MSPLELVKNSPLFAALAVVVVVVGALLAAGVGGMGFVVAVVLTILLHGIFALGLNIVTGYTGLLDLGYATFIAIGAYVVGAGLMLTSQTPTEYADLSVGKLVMTKEQREVAPAPGGLVLVRERHDLKFDVVEGAAAVRAALEAKQKTIAARHVDGLSLSVGQRVAHGQQALRFPGAILLLLVVAGGVSAGVALLRGFPTLRLTGDYYAIVTLGFAEIVALVTKNEEWLTGGAFGIKLGSKFQPSFLGGELYNDTWRFYVLVVGVFLLVLVAVSRLQSSRVGRAWAAIKADETAARASGIDVDKAKLLAFAVSGFIGGVGGGLFALKLQTITPGNFDIWLSIIVVCCLVLGGLGSIRGALLGAVILMGLSEGLRYASPPLPPEARFLVYGLILVLLMRFRSQGLLPRREEGSAPTADELGGLRAARPALYVLGEPADAPRHPPGAAGGVSA